MKELLVALVCAVSPASRKDSGDQDTGISLLPS